MLKSALSVVFPLVAVGVIVLVYVNGDLDGNAAIVLVLGALGLSALPSPLAKK